MIRDTSKQDKNTLKPVASRRALLTIGIVLFLLVSSAGIWSVGKIGNDVLQTVSRSRIRIAEVAEGPLVRDIVVQASIAADRNMSLLSPATGSVSLLVKMGDEVQKDTLIAIVDSPELATQARLDKTTLEKYSSELAGIKIKLEEIRNQHTHSIAMANLELRIGERELARAKKAIVRNSISEFEFEKANDIAKKARLEIKYQNEMWSSRLTRMEQELLTANLKVSEQRIIAAESQRILEACKIYSPVNGIISKVLVSQGEMTSKSTPIISVIDLATQHIRIDVPSVYASAITPNLEVEFLVDNEKIPGRIESMSPEVQDGVVQTLATADRLLSERVRIGQRFEARIIIDRKMNALTVLRGPFYEEGGRAIAYVVVGNEAVKRNVSFGVTGVKYVEILGGLHAGDHIVISGTAEFNNAEKVRLSD